MSTSPQLEKLIVFVEEYSMEAALEQLLPKLLGDIEFQIIRFQCKDDLLKNAPARLKGLLECMAADAGLITKTSVGPGAPFQLVNGIAIEELEAWFFGDWPAVQAAYPRVPATILRKAGFRDPDAIAGGTWEAMERVLKKAGYFSTGLRKLELARSVAKHMDVQQNCSGSFQAFAAALAAARG